MVYVSGHGFGHATRQLPIAAALFARCPSATVHFRTTAPAWLFARDLPPGARFTVTPVRCDVGLVQTDGLRFRPADTLAAVHELIAALPDVERSEKQFLERSRADVIVSDIAPFPLSWAADLGLPAIAIANFGWDAIYRSFADEIPGFASVADRFREGYARASLCLELPLALPMEGFPRVRRIPLVVRRPGRDVALLRRSLRARGRPIVFISFGGFGVERFPHDVLPSLDRYLFVLPARGVSRGNLRFLDPRRVDHPAVVAASDLVLGKPGYGLVSEVMALGKRMLYTSRGRFIEYPVLARGLRSTGQARHIPRPVLLRGHLAPYIERALALPGRPRRDPDTSGATVAADAILEAARD
ncbi:MAG: hypothetical protein U0166_19190 [Acidobacteriota bacterium]